mgnify:CR=1 FL=1
MIVHGILSSQKQPIKTTLLLAVNFGTNPNIISGIGTHVDIMAIDQTMMEELYQYMM